MARRHHTTRGGAPACRRRRCRSDLGHDHVAAGRLQGLLALQRLFFDRPRPEDVWPIEGELEARLLAVLRAAGRDPGSAWGEAGRTALRDVAGFENLEEHLLDGDRVDRAVLEHLERRFG